MTDPEAQHTMAPVVQHMMVRVVLAMTVLVDPSTLVQGVTHMMDQEDLGIQDQGVTHIMDQEAQHMMVRVVLAIQDLVDHVIQVLAVQVKIVQVYAGRKHNQSLPDRLPVALVAYACFSLHMQTGFSWAG